MLAAGDTFRAAAIDQLKIWGERAGAAVIAREPGADAAGLVFDAVTAAKNEGIDALLIDTAGRLQNKAVLMEELEKIIRVIKKVDPAAPHAVLLVLDATVGQNALSQVEVFQKTAGVTGLVDDQARRHRARRHPGRRRRKNSDCRSISSASGKRSRTSRRLVREILRVRLRGWIVRVSCPGDDS